MVFYMEKPKRATIYLDPSLHRALKLKAVESDQSISDIVCEAVRTSLREDAIDLEALRNRKDEKSRSFESFLKEMKKNGQL